jgi:hypothetical protein
MEIARAGALLMAPICAYEGLSVHRCALCAASFRIAIVVSSAVDSRLAVHVLGADLDLVRSTMLKWMDQPRRAFQFAVCHGAPAASIGLRRAHVAVMR